MLPKYGEVPALIKEIEGVAESSNLKVLKVEVLPLLRHDIYVEAPYRFTVEATYHGLAGFCDKLRWRSHALTVTEMTIQAIQQGKRSDSGNTIDATFTLSIFCLEDL